MTRLTAILILTLCSLTIKCQTPADRDFHSHVTTHIFKDCDSIKPRNLLVLDFSYVVDTAEKKLTEYLEKTYSKTFPRTLVEFELIFKKDKTICCNQIIYNSTIFTFDQLLKLRDKLFDYSYFKILANDAKKNESIKVQVTWDKEQKIKAIIIPLYIDR